MVKLRHILGGLLAFIVAAVVVAWLQFVLSSWWLFIPINVWLTEISWSWSNTVLLAGPLFGLFLGGAAILLVGILDWYILYRLLEYFSEGLARFLIALFIPIFPLVWSGGAYVLAEVQILIIVGLLILLILFLKVERWLLRYLF